jgi:hypothetical protein
MLKVPAKAGARPNADSIAAKKALFIGFSFSERDCGLRDHGLAAA